MKNNPLFQKIKYVMMKLSGRSDDPVLMKPPDAGIKAKKSFYDLKVNDIENREISFESLKGKKVLLVNTASECGYTGQYKDLEKLYNQYRDKLTVIGFPSNDFGKQEPGTEKEILEFCSGNYQITFPLSQKIKVTGTAMHPVYRWLSQSSLNGWNDKTPGWNFCKYLVDEQGELLCFCPEKINPLDPVITSRI
jgi:glutathione peroxidase